jgi:hemolysin activation/secretion protein
LLLVGTTTVAFAQVPPVPDAGRVQEQLKLPAVPKKPAVAPQIRVEPQAGETKADTPPFYVERFEVTGATAIPEAQLQRLLGQPKRQMTLAEVQKLADRVTDEYKRRGYIVARALIPAQDVRDGVIEVRVVEGRYERIDINNASELSESRIRRLLGEVREDAIVHGPALERAVLLISDLAGVQPKATLEPGAEPGYTNLVLEIVPTKSPDLDVTLDNGGSRFTGRYRLSAGVTSNSPFNIGDRLGLRVIYSGVGLRSIRVAYDAPVGPPGMRASGYLSETKYKLGDLYTSLEASGAARYGAFGVSYPFVRSSAWNLRGQITIEAREFEDAIASIAVVNVKSGQVVQWGGSGDVRDAFMGGAITAFQATMTHGRLILQTPAQVTADAASARTYGNYHKLAYALNRLQGITDNLRLALNLSGQFAADNLDSSEKFSVGGITGVRAYPAGEAAGDDAYLFQMELRYNAGGLWSGQLAPSVFLDHAHSRINHRPWSTFTGVNDRSLSAFGLGLEWATAGGVFVRAWYAHKLGGEPATADTDAPSRFWMQVGAVF